MNEQLKPCPFCGGEAYTDEATAMVIGARTGYNFAIACRDWEHASHGGDTMEVAIAAWQRRASGVGSLPAGDLVSREAAIADLVRKWSRELWADQRAHDVAGDLATLIEDLASQPAAPSVKVKALEWENSVNGRWIGTPPIKIANMAFWVFSCSEGFKRMTGDGPPMYYPTLEAAKAAAQADYEARILAALETAPAAPAVKVKPGLAAELALIAEKRHVHNITNLTIANADRIAEASRILAALE